MIAGDGKYQYSGNIQQCSVNEEIKKALVYYLYIFILF